MTQNSNRFPFKSKREIVSQLATDDGFLIECASIMEAKTVERENGTSPTGGWAASQRLRAARLLARVQAGNASSSERAKLIAVLQQYGRQLAEHFRGQALLREPALAEAAARFGVLPRAAVAAPQTEEAGEALQVGALEANGSEDSTPSEPEPPALVVLTEDESAVVALLREEEGGLRTEELALRLQLLTADLTPMLRSMTEQKLLERSGVARGTRYRLRSS